VKPRLKGRAELIRCCDDFIIGFERTDDAERVKGVLNKRFERFHLRWVQEVQNYTFIRFGYVGDRTGCTTFKIYLLTIRFLHFTPFSDMYLRKKIFSLALISALLQITQPERTEGQSRMALPLIKRIISALLNRPAASNANNNAPAGDFRPGA
jgi:hypothetical protein